MFNDQVVAVDHLIKTMAVWGQFVKDPTSSDAEYMRVMMKELMRLQGLEPEKKFQPECCCPDCGYPKNDHTKASAPKATKRKR
jgi:hypothetical protein